MYKYRDGIYDTLRTLKWNQVKLKCTVTKKLKIQNIEYNFQIRNLVFKKCESNPPFPFVLNIQLIFYFSFSLIFNEKIFWADDILIP